MSLFQTCSPYGPCLDDGKIVCLVSHHEFLWPKISRLYVYTIHLDSSPFVYHCVYIFLYDFIDKYCTVSTIIVFLKLFLWSVQSSMFVLVCVVRTRQKRIMTGLNVCSFSLISAHDLSRFFINFSGSKNKELLRKFGKKFVKLKDVHPVVCRTRERRMMTGQNICSFGLISPYDLLQGSNHLAAT